MAEWLIGLICGALLVIIGFCLQMLWDNYKYNCIKKDQEEKKIFALKEDIISNIDALKYSKNILKKELKVLPKDHVATPLPFLRNESWYFFISDFPEKLKNDEILGTFRDVVHNSRHFNEFIRSRENQKMSDQRSPVYKTILIEFDKHLIKTIDHLMKIYMKFKSQLEDIE